MFNFTSKFYKLVLLICLISLIIVTNTCNSAVNWIISYINVLLFVVSSNVYLLHAVHKILKKKMMMLERMWRKTISRCMCVAAIKPHEMQEKLGLTRLRERNWYVQPSCATTGDGLYEGLTWLTSNVRSWLWWGHVWLCEMFILRYTSMQWALDLVAFSSKVLNQYRIFAQVCVL